ncbi:DNA-3-methyladenine glycosylase family protein [Marisediminicola antarctica]|uniref:3-methyladenine DNA glycosylase n=1 Tax=Marisediminicola antarctica TaxID=674079 RepID=A0A7L5AFP1_9MICO|nr:DNA-3-methyladenine glycosylase 2 family protein [Marisediminicola antarctica]QHO68505.1 3-methyladenine DNA glycosylase [Marisediminicola antarctica]
MNAPLSTVWAPQTPVNLRQTLRPLGRGALDPTLRWDGDGVWRALRTPAGTATLHLEVRGSAVEAAAWGDGAEWAIAGVPELLGHGDDQSGFDVSGNAFLHEAQRRLTGQRLLRTNLVLEAMLAAILEQKVTSKEARRAWSSLIRGHGDPAPGPAPEGMRVFPAPSTWRLVPSWDWHRAGVDPQRSRTALAAASVASGLERTLRFGRGGADVARGLRSVPGVGVWTAAETSQRAHGDPDSVSVGDYHLPAVVGLALVGRPVDDDGMLELLEPWRGHRQRVMRIIEGSGFRKPRFGPRMTIQDHRGH